MNESYVGCDLNKLVLSNAEHAKPVSFIQQASCGSILADACAASRAMWQQFQRSCQKSANCTGGAAG